MWDIQLPDWFFGREIGPLRFAFTKLTITSNTRNANAGMVSVHPGTNAEQSHSKTEQSLPHVGTSHPLTPRAAPPRPYGPPSLRGDGFA